MSQPKSVAQSMNQIDEFQDQLSEQWRHLVQCQVLHENGLGPETATSIGVCAALSPSDVLKFAVQQGFRHVVQAGHPFVSADLNSSAVMLTDEKRFWNDPISVILNPETKIRVAEAHTIFRKDFSAARQKKDVLDQFEGVLKVNSASGSLRSDLMLIMDELFTNAIFNAPFVDLNNDAHGVARTNAEIKMPDGKTGQVFSGTDGQRIVVGCRDNFGTLNIGRLLQRVKNCYDSSVADNINFNSPGGAGVGSYLVFNNSTSYFAAVSVGQVTQICCVLPAKMSSRSRQELPKNLHILETGKKE